MKKFLVVLFVLFLLVSCSPVDCDCPPVTDVPIATVTDVTPTIEPTVKPYEPFCPNDLIWVIAEPKPLRTISNLNPSGYPVFVIYGGSVVSNRIKPNPGQEVCVWPELVRGDGGNYAYKVYTGQKVGGEWLPGTFYLYILERLATEK